MTVVDEIESQKTLRFKSALVGEQWMDNCCIHISDGIITAIESSQDSSENENLAGKSNLESHNLVALPGMVNVHSHAFQRGFAGLSEYRTAERDSFWTWRKLMYDFVDRVTPDDVYVIARQLYLEMLVAGYTWVGEFHYIHNDVGGKRYSNLSEMTEAISRAAEETGIGLCHIPVLYQRGGFHDEPLTRGQDRFELSEAEFIELVSDCKSNCNDRKNSNVGIAIHSLRAVEHARSNEVIDVLKAEFGKFPIHIHVAEQTKEVEDCLAAHGKRSVEFLFSEFDVDENWCLIHATHLNDEEVKLIAGSSAVVGLCPTTEGNLGDGYFRAADFLNAGGRIAIGGDSHCSVDFRDELRMLEYGQRLQTRGRAILGTTELSVGRRLYDAAAKGGAQAIGVPTGEIKVGNRADFTLIDPNHPAIAGATGDRLLDRVVFTNAGNPGRGKCCRRRSDQRRGDEMQQRIEQSSVEFNKVVGRLVVCQQTSGLSALKIRSNA